jgi:hypothetical protein
MYSRAWRIGFGAFVIAITALLVGVSGLFSGSAKASAVVASGSGTGFSSQIISVPTTGSYDFNYHLKSAAGYCAEAFNSPDVYESATVDLVSTGNATAMSFSTGPLVAWENPGQSLGVVGDQEVSLTAGTWTLRISWTCFNGGALASSWSYSIS